MSNWGVPLGELMFSQVVTVGAACGAANSSTVAAGAAKGAWAQFTAATTRDTHFAEIELYGRDDGGEAVFDIGIGASGSEVVAVPDITHYQYNTQATSIWKPGLMLPVNWPAGSRLALRCQSLTGGSNGYTARILLWNYANALSPIAHGGAFVTYGVTLNNANGGGTALANAVFTQLAAATTREHHGLYLCCGTNYTMAEEAIDLSVAVGGSGSEQVIWGPVRAYTRTPTTGYYVGLDYQFFHVPTRIPVGTRLSVKKTSVAAGPSGYIASIIGY